MLVAVTLAKFVLGALIVVLAILDVDPQPFMIIIGLVLMGVLTAEQLYEWFPTRPAPGPNPEVPGADG